MFDLFDDIVVSGAERVTKPDREIFQILARRLTHPIADVFYVDDNLRNVDAAREAGMDAVASPTLPPCSGNSKGAAYSTDAVTT